MTKLLEHENILKLHDVVLTTGHIILVLEYASGGVLLDVVQKDMTPFVAFQYFHTLLLTVEHCHKVGICHRDLKPENILLDAVGRLKIADFDMATQVEDGERLSLICGSPHYASPQVLQV